MFSYVVCVQVLMGAPARVEKYPFRLLEEEEENSTFWIPKTPPPPLDVRNEEESCERRILLPHVCPVRLD